MKEESSDLSCFVACQSNLGFAFVTSATEGEGGCFHPFVCVQDISKLWTDSDEIFWAGWVSDKDELIRFW